MRLDSPLGAPSWFEWARNRWQSVIGKADRQNLKCLRYDFDESHATTATSIGSIPANAVIIKPISGVYVHELFNAGTNNRLDIGTAADTDFYGTDLALTAVGFVALDESVSLRPSDTDATEIKIVVDMTGTAATTGQASVMIFYTVLAEPQ